MNKVILMGRLTKDPEVRYSQSAEPVAVARFTLAVNRKFKREGEPDADFIGCVSFGKLAEHAERFYKKGMQILVSGRLQVRTWDDQNNQRHWTTEVLIEDTEFTESKSAFESRGGGSNTPPFPEPPSGFGGAGGSNGSSQPKKSNYQQQPEGFSAIAESIDDEDLPF